MKAFKNRLQALSDSMSDLMGSSEKEEVQASGLSVYSDKDQALLKTWGVTSAQEEAQIKQLRAELELAVTLPPFVDDHYLRRFLRARKHNIAKAKQMFQDQLEWRQANDVDSVFPGFEFQERDRFFEYYPEGFYCTDRAGRPVYIQQPGKVNTDELWKFTTLERCVRYHIRQQERYLNEITPAASLASGRRQEQSIVLIDMEGVGVSTLTGEVRKILALVMNIDQDNYPELMYKTLIINAPTTFRVLWAMVRHLMDARTQAKIKVLPSDYHEALQAYIAPENLMQQYGGTNTAPLLSEPGPWQDPAIQSELTAKGTKWAEGLADFDETVLAAAAGEPAGVPACPPELEDEDAALAAAVAGIEGPPDGAPATPAEGQQGEPQGGGSAEARAGEGTVAVTAAAAAANSSLAG